VFKSDITLFPDDGVVPLIESEDFFFVLFTALSVENVYFNLLLLHVLQLSS